MLTLVSASLEKAFESLTLRLTPRSESKAMRSAYKTMVIAIPQTAIEIQDATRGGERPIRINIDSNQTQLTKTKRVALIVSDKNIIGVATVKKLHRSGNFDVLMQLDHFLLAEPELSWEALISAIGKRYQNHLEMARAFGGHIPEVTSSETLAKLALERPALAEHVAKLRKIIGGGNEEITAARVNTSEQRDAIALGLEIAGIDSRSAVPPIIDEPAVPFLRSLENSTTHEASIIRNDAQHFDDWFGGPTDTYDVWRYQDPSDPSRRVTVIYADKTPLEALTGTDLIYYREELDSFVMVQYKRMKPEKSASKPVYRPDPQYLEEISRMKKLNLKDTVPTTLSAARLSSEPFYIKLVNPNARRTEEARLAQGMYFPMHVFELLLSDKRSEGPKGGRAIGWENGDRHLSNTLFVSLVRDGWIGTNGPSSTTISDLISRTLQNNRSAILVADQTVYSETRSNRF